MGKMHARLTYANAMATTAAVAVVLAVALLAASPAHAVCTPSGTPGGGPGDDVLCGTSGPDILNGQGGADQLFGGGGADTLDGGVGVDFVDGSGGNDILIGGPGIDTIRGSSGDDQLRARDADLDRLEASDFGCGSGTDSLDIDLVDLFLAIRLPFLGCEKITVGAVNEGPNVVISRRSVSVGADGRAALRLRCPASLTAPCAGTLNLGHSAKSQGKKTHYSIEQGKKDDVSARLSHRDRRRLRRHGETTALVTSVEQGQLGDKTTIQTIKLIAQD